MKSGLRLSHSRDVHTDSRSFVARVLNSTIVCFHRSDSGGPGSVKLSEKARHGRGSISTFCYPTLIKHLYTHHRRQESHWPPHIHTHPHYVAPNQQENQRSHWWAFQIFHAIALGSPVGQWGIGLLETAQAEETGLSEMPWQRDDARCEVKCPI